MRIAIFTGSSPGAETHRTAATSLGTRLAESGIGIVYGGAHVGLMGTLADAALAAGGDVTGVIPQHLVDWEIAHSGLSRLEVVETMHERKARMADLADAFVALPGGAGTLEELFEVFTWGQLGLHTKPTALLNVDDFYGPLIDQLRHMVEQGYLRDAFLDALGIVHDADELVKFVAGYDHPSGKWAATAER